MDKAKKSDLIGKILTELKMKAQLAQDKSFSDGDVFLSLCFKNERELTKIAKLCGISH